jgi:hypothetical protein
MRLHVSTAAVLTATAVLALTGCDPKSVSSAPSSTPATTTSSSPSAGTGGSSATAKKTAKLPSFVGQGLQTAQDGAQAAGFFHLKSHDVFGRGRLQAFDRNWKVCTQTPAPGTRPTGGTVDFGTVKLDEACPAGDQSRIPDAAGKMPDFVGKSVKVARTTLPGNTSIDVRDTGGQDRMVLLESNWKICSQTPKAGSTLGGRPVTFGVVKFDESC